MVLPIKYFCCGNKIGDNLRLISLTSNFPYGRESINDEHLLEKFETFVTNLSNPRPFEITNKFRNVLMPSDNRVVRFANVNSDLMLKDTFRQHHAIRSKFYFDLVSMSDLRLLNDGATRYHISISRGLERKMVNHFNQLDCEYFDRKY
jgi:hypothetical protein